MRNLLLLILLFFAGSWVARKLRQAQERTARGVSAGGPSSGRGPGFGGARPSAERAAALPEPMVRCAHCGVHTPKGEAVSAGGEFFCSTEHAARHTTSASRGA
ncbi:PP0621 family protein [Burkholderia sp. 22PA0106]|uniref:PP0621 family protein n=1 Tax=Burkholderia sp. 22PA0106 TaxID=3237371 RepID=UPI0039C0C867